MKTLVPYPTEAAFADKLVLAADKLFVDIKASLLHKDGKVKSRSDVLAKLNSDSTRATREMVVWWLTLRFISRFVDNQTLRDAIQIQGDILNYSIAGIPGVWPEKDLLQVTGPALRLSAPGGISDAISDCAYEAMRIASVELWRKPFLFVEIRRALDLDEVALMGYKAVEEPERVAQNPDVPASKAVAQASRVETPPPECGDVKKAAGEGQAEASGDAVSLPLGRALRKPVSSGDI